MNCCERFTVRPEFLLSKISWSSTETDRRVCLFVVFFLSSVILDLLFRYVEKKKKKHEQHTRHALVIFSLHHMLGLYLKAENHSIFSV